jgi:hypothetical protein
MFEDRARPARLPGGLLFVVRGGCERRGGGREAASLLRRSHHTPLFF